MLTFEFSGVEGRMTESEVLTSGMVGKTAQFLFDDSWQDLSKTVVFRSGGICRIAACSETVLTIPADVLLQPFRKLYVGVCGTDQEGTLVIPTVMAEGPLIRYGADPTEDPTAETLPVWKNLQEQIGDLSSLQTEAKESLVAALNEVYGTSCGCDSSATGLSPEAAALLVEILRRAVYVSDQTSAIDALADALGVSEEAGDPEVTLTAITADYTGGDVPAGTAVSQLSGITVTAHYSDGSASAVTDYTLSGTIAEGENSVIVAYGGLSTAFSVTGTSEETEEATLTRISVYYSGEEVPVDTALTELENVVVTAHYSNGTGVIVSDFTLSGTIAEGENTVTVSYGGMTATFTVTGTAESGDSSSTDNSGDTKTVLYNWDFTQSLTDSVGGVAVTANNVTQDSDGAHFASADAYMITGIDINGKTVEIEFGNVEKQGTAHGRCVTFTTGETLAAANGQGMIWHSTGQWAIYGMENGIGGWSDKGITDANIIADSTLTFKLGSSDGDAAEILKDGETFITFERGNAATVKYLVLGSSTTAFYNMTIRRLTICEEA